MWFPEWGHCCSRGSHSSIPGSTPPASSLPPSWVAESHIILPPALVTVPSKLETKTNAEPLELLGLGFCPSDQEQGPLGTCCLCCCPFPPPWEVQKIQGNLAQASLLQCFLASGASWIKKKNSQALCHGALEAVGGFRRKPSIFPSHWLPETQ